MGFAIIGGTGFYEMGEGEEEVAVGTPYGLVVVYRGRLGDRPVFFLPRHGLSHGIPPHRVNYRGHIWALRELGVTNILASGAVGSMCEAMPPGSLVAINQFLDFTRSRPATFFDGEGGQVVHMDMTEPYCSHLRQELAAAAAAVGQELHSEGVYVCAEGPRFETPAEIRMFRQLGGDVVGMTGVPEVVLARELGMCYAAVATVTNWAAGVAKEPLRHDEVSQFMSRHTTRLRQLFRAVVEVHVEIECPCRAAARG